MTTNLTTLDLTTREEPTMELSDESLEFVVGGVDTFPLAVAAAHRSMTAGRHRFSY